VTTNGKYTLTDRARVHYFDLADLAAWAKLSYSHQKAHVTSVTGAKAAETRARRISAVVAKLGG